MNDNRYACRKEHFGYTFYDKSRLKHRFIKKEDLQSALSNLGISREKIDFLDTDLNDSPKGIIYSPIRAYFEITSKCNLRCRTCFNSSGSEKENELTVDEIKKALDGLRKDKILDVRFCGGEPTVKDGWYDIFKHAKELGFAVSVNTNGVYDNPETIDKLSSLNLAQITISIDGDQKFHDYIRGTGNFDRAVNTLSELRKRNARLRINTVLTRGSAKDLTQILGLASSYVEEINFFYMRLGGRALGLIDQVITPEEMEDFDTRVQWQKRNYPALRILHNSKVMQINSIDEKTSSELNLKMGGPDGFVRMNLLPDGSIWPGGYTPHLKPEFYLGNIKDEGYTMSKIWRASPVLNKFREISYALQKKCKACPEKDVKCPGASMEMEFYREKEPENKNPYCLH